MSATERSRRRGTGEDRWVEIEEPLTSADARALLRYAQATHAAVTEQRRRVATAFLALAILFGSVALLCGFKWATTAAQVDDVQDAALIDTLGVRVPDPRPAFERAELRMRAFGWGIGAAGSGLIALAAIGMFALVRPSPLPPDLQALEDRRDAPNSPNQRRARAQPPM